jgi:hypothetical protein
MRNVSEENDRPAIREMAPMTGAAVVLVVAALIACVVIYRRSSGRGLASRLQNMLPDVDDLRASLKKPLERIVKTL